MKKLSTIVAVGLVACFAFTSVAAAEELPSTEQDYGFKAFTGSKPGKVAKKGSIGGYLNPFHDNTWPATSDKTTGSAQVTPPFATTYAYVYLDKNLTFNPGAFPGCSLDKVLALDPNKSGAPAGCPKESYLGGGKAYGFVRTTNQPAGAIVTSAELQDRLFASGQKNLVYLYTYSELAKANVILGQISKASGKYGTAIRFLLPKGLISPAPGIISQLTDFSTTIPAKTYKGKALLTLKKCSGGKINSGYQGNYSGNATPKPGVNPVDGDDYVVTDKSAIINRTAKCK